MSVNRYVLRGINSIDSQIILPIQNNWGFNGVDDSIELYEDDIANELVGTPIDYEVNKFTHEDINGFSSINYNFNFYQGGGLYDENNWYSTYLGKFTIDDLKYNKNNFINSFFKIDLYDTNSKKNQKLLLTIILNANNSNKRIYQSYNINYPVYKLDYGYSNNGFNIYWGNLMNDMNLMYMSCKFYNAKTGSFVRMMNKPQSNLSDNSNFDSTIYYYYKLKFDYNNKTYSIFDFSDNRVGGQDKPINWFEYFKI